MGKAPTNRASHTSKFILKTSPAALYPRVNIKINDYKLILIHAMGENNYEKRGGRHRGKKKKKKAHPNVKLTFLKEHRRIKLSRQKPARLFFHEALAS